MDEAQAATEVDLERRRTRIALPRRQPAQRPRGRRRGVIERDRNEGQSRWHQGDSIAQGDPEQGILRPRGAGEMAIATAPVPLRQTQVDQRSGHGPPTEGTQQAQEGREHLGRCTLLRKLLAHLTPALPQMLQQAHDRTSPQRSAPATAPPSDRNRCCRQSAQSGFTHTLFGGTRIREYRSSRVRPTV